jgi:hypothetical protein
MPNRGMIKVCVLARLQAEGRKFEDMGQDELNKLVAEAITDLKLAEEIVDARL